MTSVLHVLDHSLPEHDGYSFRSHSILRELKQEGVSTRVITSPKQGGSASDRDAIEGIDYMRTPIGEGLSTSGIGGQLRTIHLTRKKIAQTLAVHSVDIIHAHSPCLNGVAAMGHGKPLVYEMRSSWEDASVSVGTTTEGSLRYRLSRALETYVARHADAIVVICDGLKKEFIAREIPENKITVVPNALPEDMFLLPDVDKIAEVRERFGLAGHKVIGFFGSFFEWEGVDCLISAFPIVKRSIPEAKLLIAGGGRQESTLRELAARLGIDGDTVFAGRVSHDEINACYAVADVMAYPRIPDRLTDMVTPLKPLEAMAQGTAVVASDVGGHRELVTDGQTGFLFKAGSHDALARTLIDVLSQPERVSSLTARAADYVRQEKRWSRVVEHYLPIYENLRTELRRS